MVVAYLKRNRLLDLEKLARGVTISLNTALNLPKTSFDGKSEILANLGPTLFLFVNAFHLFKSQKHADAVVSHERLPTNKPRHVVHAANRMAFMQTNQWETANPSQPTSENGRERFRQRCFS